MITWMQRHKKWLIITIWISTIAFVGAGFVGWGQYSYGDKAGAVAKVGKVEISQGELQKSYSRLYAKYNEMFKGNFDKAKAKEFGLQKQAFEQLVQEALLVNLAKSYDLSVSDKEMIATLRTQKYFFKDGRFDPETYKQVLSQNRLSTKEYEKNLRKELLIQKMLRLLPVKTTKNEVNILNTLINIADKINYKVLSGKDISLNTSDAVLKPFWEAQKQNFMSDVKYDVKYIKQKKITVKYDDEKLLSYYNDNKTHFKDKEGKITPFTSAKLAITNELNEKATKDKALRNYIALKKGKLSDSITIRTATISDANNPFNVGVLAKIKKLSAISPFMKPLFIDGFYYTFELIKTDPATPKTFAQAKKEVLSAYITQTTKSKLLDLANKSVSSFKGDTSKFITANNVEKLANLSKEESGEFLQKLFTSDKKRSFIALNDGKIVLYDILEQKLLKNANSDLAGNMLKLKSAIFNQALIKKLSKEYPTEKFMQGI